MKTTIHSKIESRRWTIGPFGAALVAALTLFTTAARAPAQPGWGHALSFDGNGDILQVAHNGALNAYPLTITAWINTTNQQAGRYAGLVNKYVATNGFNLYLLEGRIRASYFKNSTDNVWGGGNGLDGGQVANGNWRHVAFTVGATGGKLYVDGELTAMASWNGTPGAPTTTAPLYLGYYSGTFPGLMDDVRIWNAALTQAEIEADMNQRLTNAPPNLVAYYRFDEGAGTTAYDTTTNRFDGELLNGPVWIWQAATLPYPVPLAPSAKTAAAVTLNGLVNPNALEATAWFEWGTTTGYGTSTAATDTGSGTSLVALSATIEGPTGDTTYHYRVVGSNELGVAYGPDRSFTFRLVSNLDDNGPGSLRQTIADAAGEDIIVITNTGTLTLAGAQLNINKDLCILGPGPASLAISGNNSSRVFNVANGVSVAMSSLTIRNGQAPHGLDGTYGGDWGYTGGHGGGIYNAGGQLTLHECVLTNNRAGNGGKGGDGANGGAGSNGGSGGDGGDGGIGGAIFNYGVLRLEECTISGNFSGSGGLGGKGGNGGNDAFLTDPGNGGIGGAGGYGGAGAGLFNYSGVATLNRCTVSGNTNGAGGNGATGGNGGGRYLFPTMGGDGNIGGPGGLGGDGGGVYSYGQTTLNNCTISGNMNGKGGSGGRGGDGGVGPLLDGQWGSGGNGGDGGSGGGLYNSYTTMELLSCTIAYNSIGAGGTKGSHGGGNNGGGQDGNAGVAGIGGGIRSGGQAPSLFNTIVAINPAVGSYDVVGAFSSLGHNLVLNINGSTGFGASGDVLNMNPLLEPLADNGGPTLTHAPSPTSPVINAGNNRGAPETDQPGFPRIAGGTIDIGACEFQSPQSLISYAWLQQYGWVTDGSVDFLDLDGDHMNNWQEWHCGTAPNNALSALRMLTPSRTGSGVVLSWQSVTDRTYFLERAMQLGVPSAFQTLATNLAGQLGTTAYTDTNAASGSALFYRIGVEQ
jgi:hypothetical protein